MPQFDATSLISHFTALLGADRIREPHGLEAQVTSFLIEPENSSEISEIVRKCERDRIPLAPLGGARTLAINCAPIGISLARMNRVLAYEPDDMTVVAEAGVTLGALNLLASAHNQRLPADPRAPELTTLGSLIAGAKAGPIRLSEGTIRDLLIGIRFVGHDGRLIHAGGQVVKNVAGYDLMKVMTGSFGTLGIIVEAAFKVRPIPPGYHCAIASFATIADAFEAAQACARAAALFHCDVLSRAVAPSFRESQIIDRGDFLLLAGFGGICAELEHQRIGLDSALGDNLRILEEAAAEAAYRALRDLAPNSALAAQIAVKPAELARCLEGYGAEFRAHALNGIAQVFRSAVDDRDLSGTVARWRNLAHAAGGHMRVLAAPLELRDNLQIFDTPAPPAIALMHRLKASFDPHNVFNPGCFVAGI